MQGGGEKPINDLECNHRLGQDLEVGLPCSSSITISAYLILTFHLVILAFYNLSALMIIHSNTPIIIHAIVVIGDVSPTKIMDVQGIYSLRVLPLIHLYDLKTMVDVGFVRAYI